MSLSLTELRIFNRLLKKTQRINLICCHSTAQIKDGERRIQNDRDPLPVFCDERVQTLLRRMTGFDISKIFAPKLIPNFRKPKFRLLTDEELKQAQEKAIDIASKLLEMPPFMKAEPSQGQIISKDHDISKALDAKFVFTDISKRLKDKDRFVAVREKDGTLRLAYAEEKRRACQMFNPVKDRSLIMPRMFEDENLQNILDSSNYKYILDRACIQFEPDNPDFIRVCSRIYEHVSNHMAFEVLRSTRFFGTMAFYLAWNKKIENLLLDMLTKNLYNDAFDLLRLYQVIHHPAVNLSLPKTKEFPAQKQVECLMIYVKRYANPNYRPKLELAVQNFQNKFLQDEKELSEAS